MDRHFKCTLCGNCCRNLKLPLTATEAVDWLDEGHPVQILCDAAPWTAEPSVDDRAAAHRKRRSFAVMSGSMPSRVVVILAANLAGACPNLGPDMRCGIYERRPLVCRIYPAEINPLRRLEPAQKLCPPEAWTADHPLLQRDEHVMSESIRRSIQRSRDTDAMDVEVKRRVCAELRVSDAAVADEGLVLYSPTRLQLSSALSHAIDASGAPTAQQWRFVSHRSATIDALTRRGAIAFQSPGAASPGAAEAPPGSDPGALPYEYLGFTV